MLRSGATLSKKTFVYTGCENLEAMTEAVNYNNFLISLILRQLKKKNAKVLDFGAGSGTYAKMLKEHYVTPDCLEPDEALQGELKKAGFKVLKSNKELKPNTYDVIYALNVFEHIEDDFAEIAKLREALKKGGRLVIYVPAYQALFSSMDEQVGHYRRYRTKRLKQMAQQGGLKIRGLYYYDPLGFGAALVYKWVGGSGTLTPGSVRLYDRIAFPVSRAFHPLSKKLIGKNAVLVAEK
ncbi:MAG TPA: class I SAM-dependent methyltransferase [Candidatus Saccharimonadia bacterium]|nr:class I SAM-dependent methyltransferase [Candidatus Saccharimonadia bacterium]